MTGMKRRDIRKLKRAAGQDDGAAICALLARSVQFGHKRLALLRCIQAEQMGALIAPALLEYCRGIAEDMPVEELHKLIEQAGRGHAPGASGGGQPVTRAGRLPT